jgi:hypothetical protein
METNTKPVYTVERRPIKYPRIEYKTGALQLILPINKDDKEFFERHRAWIEKRETAIQDALKEAKGKTLSERDEDLFRRLVNKEVGIIQSELDTPLGKTFFREMRSKWASYSTSHNITVNTLMKHLPEHLIYYILYHELAHAIEKRHNERFWMIIQKKYPNHDALESELFSYWFLIQNIKGGFSR